MFFPQQDSQALSKETHAYLKVLVKSTAFLCQGRACFPPKHTRRHGAERETRTPLNIKSVFQPMQSNALTSPPTTLAGSEQREARVPEGHQIY